MTDTHNTPVATYRLQLTPDFTFDDAAKVARYPGALGVSHVYLSPVCDATPGSGHGYDVTDPNRLRPELGGEDGFNRLASAMDEAGLRTIVDIVPNHMSATHHNPWWYDVMQFGKNSEFARFFDIDWSLDPEEKLVLPVLGGQPEDMVTAGEITLAASGKGLELDYYGSRFPLSPRSYATAFRIIRSRTGGAVWRPLEEAEERLERELSGSAGEASESVRSLAGEIARSLRRTGAVDGVKPSITAMHSLLEAQHYRLEFWRTGLQRLNYRRFFDISGLVGVRVEDNDVFNASHSRLRREVEAGRVHGVRVDHVDGMRDPGTYLDRLRVLLDTAAGGSEQLPVYVEKILAPFEELPDRWPVQGTTGYEFAAVVSGALVEPDGVRALQEFNAEATSSPVEFSDVEHAARLEVIDRLFSNELSRLALALARLAEDSGTPIDNDDCAAAVRAITARMEVYRTYGESSDAGNRRLAESLNGAGTDLHDSPGASRAFAFMAGLLTGGETPPVDSGVADFLARWRQLTGAVAGKGVEDTAFYRYAALTSLNEVGGEPAGESCCSVEAFHAFNARRAEADKQFMNATSTHDTKRSEDARARIHVLSELADEWRQLVAQWREVNARLISVSEGVGSPSVKDELLFYQSLLGVWPFDPSETALEGISQRLADYMVKAAREAKQETDWHEPDEAYESGLQRFVSGCVTGPEGEPFRESFTPFAGRVAFHGALNSLTQALFKAASPGFPDIYRGTETWDFSLVDPDNRRPVDFAALAASLDRMRADSPDAERGLAQTLLERWQTGEVKQWLTHRGLLARREHTALFVEGDYAPLVASGPRAECCCAFMRHTESDALIAAGARLTTRLGAGMSMEDVTGSRAWAEASLAVPDMDGVVWTDVLTGRRLTTASGGLELAEVFDTLPVALLISTTLRRRGPNE